MANENAMCGDQTSDPQRNSHFFYSKTKNFSLESDLPFDFEQCLLPPSFVQLKQTCLVLNIKVNLLFIIYIFSPCREQHVKAKAYRSYRPGITVSWQYLGNRYSWQGKAELQQRGGLSSDTFSLKKKLIAIAHYSVQNYINDKTVRIQCRCLSCKILYIRYQFYNKTQIF